MKKPQKHHTDTRARTTAVFFEKRRKQTQQVSTIGIQIQQELTHFSCREDNGRVTGRQMASGWQIYRILGLLAIKMGRQQIPLSNQFTHQTTTSTNKTRKRTIRPRAEHSRLKWTTTFEDTGRSSEHPSF